jgi:hypothetical protein
MSDDIVTQLREFGDSYGLDYEAADEIERLREAGDRLAYWVLRENVSRELIAFARAWKAVRGE